MIRVNEKQQAQVAKLKNSLDFKACVRYFIKLLFLTK